MSGRARRTLAAVAAVTAVAGAATAIAMSTTSGEITACAKHENGQLRLVETADDCRPSEDAVTWNAQGPPGPPGQDGDDGANGAPGPSFFLARVDSVFGSPGFDLFAYPAGRTQFPSTLEVSEMLSPARPVTLAEISAQTNIPPTTGRRVALAAYTSTPFNRNAATLITDVSCVIPAGGAGCTSTAPSATVPALSRLVLVVRNLGTESSGASIYATWSTN